MNRLIPVALALCLPLFGACQRDATPPPPDAAADSGKAGTEAEVDAAPRTGLGRAVARAIEEARKELRDGNLSLNGDAQISINGKQFRRDADNLPSAEITPTGDLIVAGQTIAMDEASRTLARQYRENLISVANAGMDLGVQGADLGVRAASDAITSIFRGDTEGMEARIEAEAQRLEASAMQLCEHLPALLAAQQALAEKVPEFQPYATMQAADIEDCRERDGDADATAENGSESTDTDAAARADAAAEDTSNQ